MHSPFVRPISLTASLVACADVLTRYKHEENGVLDYTGTGVNRKACEAH